VQGLGNRFTLISETLGKQPYVTGNDFTVADAYLFTVLNWSGILKVDLAPWPALVAFQQRVAARPAVQKALKAEGLVK
jgi:glutathione S-transferase